MKYILIAVCIFFLSACSSVTVVELDESTTFPELLVPPFDTHATLVINNKFKTHIAKPNKTTHVDIGLTQRKLFARVIQDLFASSDIVETTSEDGAEQVQIAQKPEGADSSITKLIIEPSVQEIQTAIPTESQLKVFEVWIKYQLLVRDENGEPLADWYMPAYGKTTNAFMRSKEKALEQATIMAMRDAAANMSISFHRVPEINQWLKKHKIERVKSDD